MNFEEFTKCLKLENKILSITLSNEEDESYMDPKYSCIIQDIDKLPQNTTLKISNDNLKCPGAGCGSGFNDTTPNIPGGFGYFLSYGKGEGYIEGERIKESPEIAEEMFENQPKNVLKENKFILVKHFEESDSPTSVLMKVNPDQLSVLIYLFDFQSPDYDPVYASVSAGCASVFRMPLHEAFSASKRGVIGNLDIASRIYTDKNEVYFTVPGTEFFKMINNAGDSLLITKEWDRIRNRME
ncbi:DUF169 domain-containing protein [Methanobrevibacter sp. OttesenSCG-928-I08]|nr:DUF169 domain-containing protein [Methanobrevibacter sp. OttesenSCG-928-I08]